MEGSESEAIFDSLNLNPQLFINEVLNIVDELVEEAFEFYLQQASRTLKIEGTERSDDPSKGVDYFRNMVRSVLDERMSLWEKYCLRFCFTVPEGFSLPKVNESTGDSSMDTTSDGELDAQLDSLRNKLALVGKETAELNRELQQLKRQSVLRSHADRSVNKAMQLYEQNSVQDMFQELTKTASELYKKMEQLRAKRLEQSGRIRKERMLAPNGDHFGTNRGKGLFNATMEELQEFIADMKNV